MMPVNMLSHDLSRDKHVVAETPNGLQSQWQLAGHVADDWYRLRSAQKNGCNQPINFADMTAA
jgi:hypothetical protein